MLAASSPAKAASLVGLHYLVGTWSCTYRAGASRFAYGAVYTYDRNGHVLRQIDSWPGGGGEELLTYDARRGWTALILDDQGNATIMRAPGNDPNHIAYHSVYPDASIAERFDTVSATEYTLHAKVHAGGKTTASVDTCVRRAR